MVSSLSPNNLHLLFCYVLSFLALIWLVLMALFCATIRRDSVSLLKFPFLIHVHVFSGTMLLVSCLKRPYSCFSSHFCFLVMIRDVSIVSGCCYQSSSTLFYVVLKSLNWCVNAVFKASKTSPPFILETYNLSTSSLGCNALCMVIIFFFLWSICLSSS